MSTGGGTLPRWAPGSHELFFVDDGGLMSAPIAADPALAPAGASRVWGMPAPAGEHVIDYDIAPDAGRFLVIVEKRAASIAPTLIVVRNWLEELRTRFRSSP